MIPFLTYPLALLALATVPALAAIYILRNRFRRRQVSSLLLWRFQVQSKAGGAKIHAGGTHAGLHFRPTVLTGVKPGMKLYEEETFGPVAIVYPFANDDEAVRIANDTLYGLAAAVQTRNLGRGRAVTERLLFGNVHVNDATVMDYSYVPWGGFNYAGNGGRYGKYANWEEYTQWKWTTLRDAAVLNHFTEGK